MKRKFTKLAAAFALIAALCFPLGMWGQTREVTTLFQETFAESTGTMGWSGTACNGTLSADNSGWTFANGYGANAAAKFGTSSKLGSAQTPAIDFTGDATLTFKAGAWSGDQTTLKLSGTNCTLSVSTVTLVDSQWSNYTVQITEATGNVKIKFEGKQASKARFLLDDVVVTQETGGTQTVATPVISPNGGNFVNNQVVTITCGTEGAAIHYSYESNPSTWLDYTAALNLTETTTVYAYASMDDMEDSEVAEATFTKVTPLTTMQAIFDKATAVGSTATSVYITMDNWVVSGVSTNGKNVFVTDGTKGFVIFDNGGNMGFAAGNILSGTVSCKVQLYNGFAELTQLNSTTSGLSIATGGTVTAANIDMADLAGVNTGALVHYDNLTCSVNNNKYYLSDGTTTLQVYNAIYAFGSVFVADHVYNITGVYQQFNANNAETKEVLPRSADDIEAVVTYTPIIDVNKQTLSGFTYEFGSGPSTTQTITVSGEHLTANISMALDNDSNFEMCLTVDGSYTNSLTLTQSSGEVTSTTVYVRLKSGLSVDNYSDNITLTSTGATTKTVELSGSVTAVQPPHYTWDLSVASYASASTEQVTWTSDYATMVVDKANASTNANNYLGGTNSSTRFYKSSVLTITPATGYAISSVVFEATTSGYATALSSSTWTNASASVDDKTVTVTPTNGANAISAVIGATCGFTSVTVYYQTVDVAPVWSELPTPAINKNVTYEINLNEYVTGSPAPTITLQTSVSNELYELADGELMFESNTNGTYVFNFTATNTAGSADATLTITVATVYIIEFYVNNVSAGSMTVIDGNALGTLPVPSQNIPAGFNFVGWMESPDHAYYNATTAPTMVSSATEPEDDMILEAVFCIGETAPGTWELSSSAPVNGQQLVLAVNEGGTYYAMNGPAVESVMVSNNTIVGNPDAAFEAEEFDGFIALTKDGEQYVHLNSNAIKIANGTTNGLLDFTPSGTGYLVSTTVIVNENEVTRYIKYNTDNFTVTTDQSEASTLYVFSFTPGATTNVDYTTSVINHADGTFIAENAAETLYGIHYIDGYVLAGNAVTNSGKLVVNDGGELDMDISDLTNNTAANLIIEDGAQLKIANTVKGTIEKAITGYSSYTGSGNGGYYLLATPASMDACNQTGMWPTTGNDHQAIQANIDFYSFDQSAQMEWQNFKHGNTSFAGPYLMKRGQGYLYANPNDVTLTLKTLGYSYPSGQTVIHEEYPFEPTNVTYTVSTDDLGYTEGADWAGWNLVGNPFTCEAYLNRTYFRMNEDGDAIVEGSGAIKPCEGVFVVVTSDNKTVTFSDTPTVKSPRLSINLNGNNKLMDRVSLRFDGSNNIKKYVLNENASKLYIQQGTKDYAVVRSNAEGEMPVSFKASENGTYTLAVEAENVEMNYLHLIDNLTGMDVDLLQTPSYTFEAKTSDYASRFRLVFKANGTNENNAETFAYFNGTNWTVSNVGDATLQVVDVTGRTVANQMINGNAELNLNQPAGVYVIRLVNGDNVKTQKVVVR